MQKKFSSKELESASSRQKMPLQCLHCQCTFFKEKRYILSSLKSKRLKYDFCSNRCQLDHQKPANLINCAQCGKSVRKAPSDIRSKSGNHFCSKSCAAKWNNAHKKHGTRRSKLEAWLEEQLLVLFPSLEFHFNRKDAINSELDIYIPSLKLAFELNGIFHYEPIFGPEKLASIQNNDQRKFQACIEAGIELCIIDASSMTYFKPKKAQKYLDIISSVIGQPDRI